MPTDTAAPAIARSGAPSPSDTAPDFPHWQRNLYVCLFGSFSTGVAMTLLLPFLPLYLEQLGVQGHAALAQWSGLAFAATFLSAGLAAPLWGRMADRYGRKLMLIRASLGMAITMALIGVVANAWQLVALRLVAGLVGGYASGSMVLVATQTPKERTGWALGTLSSGFMAGNLLGPLVGGSLPPLIGIRATFFLAGGVIFIAFLATCFLIRETRPVRAPVAAGAAPARSLWAQIPDRRPVLAMLLTGLLLTLAHMSVEPIITVYIAQLLPPGGPVTWYAGLAMSAGALGNILAAPRLGKLADRVGYHRVIVACLLTAAVLLLPQAFVTNVWQLVGLRFLMGAALAGLLPCITSVIRHSVPAAVAGGVLGYATSSQYAGQVAGPLLGGLVGGHIGMRAVFLATSALMVLGAVVAARSARQSAAVTNEIGR
ncbi:MFS transporter [Rhodoferax sp.]|uniref:MFS transporter n=1 Tax=Rhodoferax sp. TaxID=50421 RepID=UPI00374DCCFC